MEKIITIIVEDDSEIDDNIKKHEHQGIILANIKNMDFALANKIHSDAYQNIQACVSVFEMNVKACHILAFNGEFNKFLEEKVHLEKFIDKLRLTLDELQVIAKETFDKDKKTLN
jgi:hypothetical protein